MVSSFLGSLVLKVWHSFGVAFGCFKKLLVASAGGSHWAASSGSLSGLIDAVVESQCQPWAWHADPSARNVLL